MTVSFTLQLPSQDVGAATALVRFTALGGNGFNAPKGMYTIRNFSSTGDATAGSHTHSIIMDPNYCSMVAYSSMLIAASAAARDVRFSLVGPAVPLQAVGTNIPRIFSVGGHINYTWMPPAFINPGKEDEVPTLQVAVLNVDTETLAMNAVIYLYDIRAREASSFGDLIAARGGMYQGPSV